MYISNCIPYVRWVDLSFLKHSINSVFVEVNGIYLSHASNVIIGVIYKPPDQCITEFNEHISMLLNIITRENKIVYLLGL